MSRERPTRHNSISERALRTIFIGLFESFSFVRAVGDDTLGLFNFTEIPKALRDRGHGEGEQATTASYRARDAQMIRRHCTLSRCAPADLLTSTWRRLRRFRHLLTHHHPRGHLRRALLVLCRHLRARGGLYPTQRMPAHENRYAPAATVLT